MLSGRAVWESVGTGQATKALIPAYSEIRRVARSNWDGLSRGGALRQLSLVVAPYLG